MSLVIDPAALTTVEACQEAMSAAVRGGRWLEYFQLRRHWEALENAAEPVQPPPQVTTRDSWPDDVVAPSGAVRFRLKVEAAGWDVRMGYARSWRKSVGRGIYKLHHYVIVQAARNGAGLHARWRCPVEGKVSWSFDSGQVNGWPVSTLAEVVRAVESPS